MIDFMKNGKLKYKFSLFNETLINLRCVCVHSCLRVCLCMWIVSL